MAKERVKFRAGATARGIDEGKADEVFDLMEKFAGYGFNKSHAAAYSLLAYHTAWLKVHCTAEFYAANMTIEADDTDKLKVLIVDAKLFGIAFEPPDVNRGRVRFEPVSDRVIRYGLGAVKGTGAGAIEAIVAARDGTAAKEGQGGGPFRSLFDFCARVDRKLVNKRVVEALIKAGAFDALHAERVRSGALPGPGEDQGDAVSWGRAQMLASVGLAFEWADTQDANVLQGGLFDFGVDGELSHGASHQEPSLAAADPWSIRERLMQEKAALGFFLSGHLFDESAPEVRRFAKRAIADLVDTREPQLVAGVVSGLRIVNGHRGRAAIFQLDDGSAGIDTVVGEALLDAQRDWLRDDELLVVQGRVQPDRFGGGLRLNVSQLWDLAAARARFGRYLSVALNGGPPPIAELVQTWPPRRVETEAGELRQGLAVRLQVVRPQARAELDLGDAARFWPCDEALQRWRALADGGRADVVYELPA
jgi:DNA polymerase-3 subunit alpha